jgi:hypothetical protein
VIPPSAAVVVGVHTFRHTPLEPHLLRKQPDMLLTLTRLHHEQRTDSAGVDLKGCLISVYLLLPAVPRASLLSQTLHSPLDCPTFCKTSAPQTPKFLTVCREVTCDQVGVLPKGAARGIGGGANGQSFSTTQAPAAPVSQQPEAQPAAQPAPQPATQPAAAAQPAQQPEPEPAPQSTPPVQQPKPEPAPQSPPVQQPEPQPQPQSSPAQQPEPQPAPQSPAQQPEPQPAPQSPPAQQQAAPALPQSSTPLPKFAQCGGMEGSCSGSLCKDEPFEGYTCSQGLKCFRQNR